MMEWKYVTPLLSEDLIAAYEEKIGYRFPEDFRECVKQNNNGYPEKKNFCSWQGKSKRKRVFRHLLSFNKEDASSIWRYNDWHGDWLTFSNGEIANYVTFAGDPFGNLICFDKRTDEIVWINHEEADFSAAVESVAKSFTEMLNHLKK